MVLDFTFFISITSLKKWYNPVSQIASSKQKSSLKINKAPSTQPVHAFQSSLPDINPKYFSPPGGK
jgi:hypothetical protein